MSTVMDIPAVEAFLAREFPQADGEFAIENLDPVRLRLLVGERHLRPGNTISGPSMFALADVAFYIAVLAEIGPEALAVTTNISMDFMRKPPGDAGLWAETRMLKRGRSLAVGDALLFSDAHDKPVARASLTYSIPPK